MAIAFSEDDKSKVKFNAIKKIYPISINETVEQSGAGSHSFYLDIYFPADITMDKLAFVVNGSLYNANLSEVIGTVVIGEPEIFGGYTPDTDEFIKYPTINYYASAAGKVKLQGMIIEFY